ncbi:MAG TPA: WavE lipopolysaccharide synthesis family protein [Legionella sp.]|nr:WavE lipopolysaccharide synthesis family protein [Legionella sp.]
MIDDKDISIVVQGPIIKKSAFNITDETTKLACLRLKQLFPQAEIILSTWMGEDVLGIPYDQVLFNQDPGATWFNYEDYNLLNNCNRLIVSTLAGIKAATRKYVFKVRSDLFLVSKNFLSYFYKFPLFNNEYKFVTNRIIAFSLYSTTGHKTCLFTMKRPFHISDWAYFGYKEDLLDLFDIPLTEEPEFSQWFLHRCKDFFDIEPHRLWKMPPEQYVTLSFLQKHCDVRLKHTADISDNNMERSARLLVNNFLVLDQTQFSLISMKYLNFQLLFDSYLSHTAIFYSTFLQNYCHYMPVSKSLLFKYKIIVFWRKVIYRILNIPLRLINGKSRRISRLVSYFIKQSQIETKQSQLIKNPE